MAGDLINGGGPADVIVAGSGAAGLTAALAAAVGGARVLLAERAAELGGTTALSFGRVWVPGNHLSAGDSPDAARAYLEGLFSDRYPHMTEAFARSAPTMTLFVERHTQLRFLSRPALTILTITREPPWLSP